MFRAVALTVCLWAVSGPAAAHEFWIDLQRQNPPMATGVQPVVMIGEALEGKTYPFEPRAFAQVIWSGPTGTQPFGQKPLAEDKSGFHTVGHGLHILAVESFPRAHRYRSEQSFRNHIASIGLGGRVNTAGASVMADGSVTETYRRFSKTLLELGGSGGSDRRVGLEKEWVLGRHGFRLYSGRRVAKRQPAYLSCLPSDGGPVSTVQMETDGRGRLDYAFPASSQCLLNAVFVNRQADGSWASDWVSTFFPTDLVKKAGK